MTKGRIILKALVAKRRLRSICLENKISYKFAHAVSEGIKNPSYELIMAFRFLIPVDYWFDEASGDFILKVKEAITEQE